MADDAVTDAVGFLAFRVQLLINGQVGVDINIELYQALFDTLNKKFGFSEGTKSFNLPGKKTRSVSKVGRSDSNFAIESIGVAWDGAEGFRFYGREKTHSEDPIGIPYLALEQVHYADYSIDDAAHYHFIEIAIVEGADLQSLISIIEEHTAGLEIFYGVAGYGFFIPPANYTDNFIVAEYSPNLPAAIGLMARDIGDAVKKTTVTGGSRAHPSLANVQPGIPDIGWKTWVGPEYWDRLDLDRIEAVASEVVTINRTEKLLTLTAGTKPVWGKEGDDLSPYREVATLLRPIRVDSELVRHFPFFAEHPDETIAYIERFGR